MSFLDSYCCDVTSIVVDEIKGYHNINCESYKYPHHDSSGVSTPPCGSSDLQHEWESERWNCTGHDDLDTESDGPPRVRIDVVV